MSTSPIYACYVCSCEIGHHPKYKDLGRSKTIHHLIPQSLHSDLVESTLYTLEECRTSVVDLCWLCHESAHRFFTNREMARYLSTPTRLRSALAEVGWLEWVSAAEPLKPSTLQTNAFPAPQGTRSYRRQGGRQVSSAGRTLLNRWMCLRCQPKQLPMVNFKSSLVFVHAASF